jgi:rhodanese-related sulfurtransferase
MPFIGWMAAELASIMEKLPNAELLDVRKKSEFDSEHVVGAVNAPLDYINESMKLVDKNKNYFVYCAGGYRSMIFCLHLKGPWLQSIN